jgi:hypothetical protein
MDSSDMVQVSKATENISGCGNSGTTGIRSPDRRYTDCAITAHCFPLSHRQSIFFPSFLIFGCGCGRVVFHNNENATLMEWLTTWFRSTWREICPTTILSTRNRTHTALAVNRDLHVKKPDSRSYRNGAIAFSFLRKMLKLKYYTDIHLCFHCTQKVIYLSANVSLMWVCLCVCVWVEM